VKPNDVYSRALKVHVIRLVGCVAALLLVFSSPGTATVVPDSNDDALTQKYAFNRAGFGNSTLPFWYELTDFERTALGGIEAARVGDAQALLALAVMASGDERTMQAWEKYRGRLDEFVRRIRPEVGRATGSKARGRVVFDEMWKTFFKQEAEKEGLHGYDAEQSQLTELLRTGRYNCISSTLLYLVCARYFGLTVKGVELPSHVFVQLETETGDKLDIETTSSGGFGLVHDETFYRESSGDWYKARKLHRSTWQDYLDRRIREPYQTIALNMLNQHTSEERMSLVDENRLLEASGYLFETDRQCMRNRLVVYTNEYSHFLRAGDTLSMLRMFSRVGPVLQDLKRFWMRDTALAQMVGEFLEHQYEAFLLNGRESEALALLPDAMEFSKTGDPAYVSMMKELDRITDNHCIRQTKRHRFEPGLRYLDRYASCVRPGAELVECRSLIHESWGNAYWEQANWEQAIAQYGKALTVTRDTVAAERMKKNIVNVYLRWAGDLWGKQAWQQVVEKCSTAQSYAQSEETLHSVHERIVGAYMDWCNALMKTGAWAAAMEKISKAEPYANSRELRNDLAETRVSVHESWARALQDQKHWELAIIQYRNALSGNPEPDAERRIKENIAGVYLSWSSALWDAKQWQQVVEKCSTAQVYTRSDERKQSAQRNMVGAYVNWSGALAKSAAWPDALEKLTRAEALAQSGDRRKDMVAARVYVHESWAQSYQARKQWEQAIAQLNEAASGADDPDVVRRVKDGIAGVYLSWSSELWAARSWQQVVEKCSTAMVYAQSDELKQASRKNLVSAYINWSNALSGSGAWEEALATVQTALKQVSGGDQAQKCASATTSIYSAWGSALFKREQWQEAIEKYGKALTGADTGDLRSLIRTNIQAAYINWSLGLRAEKDREVLRRVLQQCVDQCPGCTKCKAELDRLFSTTGK
jgi:tetratricopeptide (TPR) repeat protein